MTNLSDRINKFINKQQPSGIPPRPGLIWKPETHRWVLPEESVEDFTDWNNKFPKLKEWFSETRNPSEVGQLKRKLRKLNDTGVTNIPEGAINGIGEYRLKELRSHQVDTRTPQERRIHTISEYLKKPRIR